eukprot:g78223.t1
MTEVKRTAWLMPHGHHGSCQRTQSPSQNDLWCMFSNKTQWLILEGHNRSIKRAQGLMSQGHNRYVKIAHELMPKGARWQSKE